MGVEIEEDIKRKMIELNLAAARKFLSPQTNYLHLHYDSEERCDAIPLLENFCYALALLRSRLADNMLEGKERIEKLLPFEVDGNFPIYLHEYPQCKDRIFSLDILPALHWALADYRAALGEKLAVHLEGLVCRILSHAYKMHAQRPLSKSAEFRLKRYYEPDNTPSFTPTTPTEWADLLITLQMTGGHMPDAALQKWHSPLCAYIGTQFHDRAEPQVTLLDLFMGHYYGSYSQRALKDSRVHLLASLVQPFETEKNETTVPNEFCGNSYAIYWGSTEKLHSFASGKECTVVNILNGVELTFTLPTEARPDAHEVSFFMSLDPSHRILIDGVPATTFCLGDPIELIAENLQIRLELEIESGEGDFFGHILRANRPSQRGKNLKFETYDWQIALRTIRHSENCRIKAKITR